jgi:presenilin-like A22 family membrane protease
MKFRISFFLKEAVLFAAALAMGIFIAYHYGVVRIEANVVEPIDFSWSNVIVMVAVFLGFSFVMARFRRLASIVFQLFLFFVVFFGADLFFGAFLQSPRDLLATIATLGLMYALRNVLTHNIGIMLAIAGISAAIGLGLTPDIAMFVLMAMAIYDIIAVYRTRHMVRLAENMVQSGAIFGFIIPLRWRDFFTPRDKAKVGEDFMILGSGDIGVPLLFIASTVTTSLPGAIITAAFALMGLFITHLLFVNQKSRQAMAALPPIATASVVGYLISLFLV